MLGRGWCSGEQVWLPAGERVDAAWLRGEGPLELALPPLLANRYTGRMERGRRTGEGAFVYASGAQYKVAGRPSPDMASPEAAQWHPPTVVTSNRQATGWKRERFDSSNANFCHVVRRRCAGAGA